MKIVILDGYTTNPGDLSWSSLSQFGEVTDYDYVDPEHTIERIGDAECIIVSDTPVTEELLTACPSIRFVSELATGYNNIDVEACRNHGVAVYNVPKYSTEAVAQHTIALLLQMANHVNENDRLSREGIWFNKPEFTYDLAPVMELAGKTMGIIGYGSIGKRVASIAEALGMKILIYSRDGEKALAADVLTLHCPLTAENRHMVNSDFIGRMKDGAILLNTARGGLIDEEAVAAAVKSGKLSGYGTDVLEEEPPEGSCLFGLKNVYITPHVAWVSSDTRQKIIDRTCDNLKAFLEGTDSDARIV